MRSIFQSRVFWLAVFQAIASVLVVLFTELDMAGYAMLVKSVVDIVLRVDTTSTIDGRGV